MGTTVKTRICHICKAEMVRMYRRNGTGNRLHCFCRGWKIYMEVLDRARVSKRKR